MIRPDIHEKLSRDFASALPLPRITSGQSLIKIISGTHALGHFNDAFLSEVETELVSGIIQNVQDWTDIIDEIEAGEHVRLQHSFDQEIKTLEEAGFGVYAAVQKGKQSRR